MVTIEVADAECRLTTIDVSTVGVDDNGMVTIEVSDTACIIAY